MSNKFLLVDGEANVTNGTTNLFGATIGGANLLTNYPIKTNSIKQLVSTKLDISDVNNLQSQLDNGISNPYVGIMEATDFKTSTHTSFNTETTVLKNKTQNQTATAGTTTFAGTLTAGTLIKSGGTSSQYLMADGSALQYSANSGNSNFYLYKSHTNTPTPPPTAGLVYYNNATQKNATIIYISHKTDDNIDIEVFFSNLSILNDVYIQQKTLSENFIKYNITATPTIVAGSHIAIPVAYLSFGGTGETYFGNLEPILVSFFTNTIETDSRITTLETKTQNQTGIAGETNYTGLLKINGVSVVSAPASATTNAIARYTDTSGKLIKNSTVLLSDGGSLTGVFNLTCSNMLISPTTLTNTISNELGTSSITMGSGVITISGNIAMWTNKITGLGAPTNPTDGANKSYVDNQKGVLDSYTIATLPTAVGKTGALVYCTDDFNGAVPAFSDGGTWRKVTDRNVVSTTGVWVQPTMTSNTTPFPFVVSASTIYDNTFNSFQSFDNNIATSWVSSLPVRYSGINPGLYTGTVSTTVSGVAVLGEWLQLAFTSAVISTYTIIVVDNYKTNAAPTSWILAGSTNSGITWTMLDTRTRVWGGNNAQSYVIPFPIAINTIRIIVKEIANITSNVSYAAISQLNLS